MQKVGYIKTVVNTCYTKDISKNTKNTIDKCNGGEITHAGNDWSSVVKNMYFP